jgi:hypothetical protein
MFVTMRRYSPKNGAITRAALDLLRRQVYDDFIPVLRMIPGFHGYYVLNVGGRELITISMCDNQEGSEEASRCAADYTLRNPLVYELGRPEVTEGEILTFGEANPASDQDPERGEDAVASAIALWLEESRAMLVTAPER